MRHDPQLRRFVNRLGDGRVVFKLQSSCDDVQDAKLVLRSSVGRVTSRGAASGAAAYNERPLHRLGHVNGSEYFAATVEAGRQIRYAFKLDSCGRPRWLTPGGLQLDSDMPSEWFTYDAKQHEAFETPAWVRDAVFYQIFPERFCNGNPKNDPPNVEPWGSPPTTRNFMGGDLQGILDKLDYLEKLGVTALYLTPIFRSNSSHKYDTIDYFAVDPHFGSMSLLRKLVDSCHKRGIRIILDAVFNHCSHLHPYFLDVKERGKKSRYWDWFFIKKWPIPNRFAKHKDALEWYECWWGFHTLPKLNFNNPEVEEYFLEVAQFWLREAHVDGWRLDVPNEVIESFWPKFRRAVKEANPEAYIVGEIWDDATPWLQGDQFDAVMNYRFQKALLGYFAEETLDTKGLDHMLRQIMLDYPEQATAVMLNLLGSHDTARPMTATKGDLDALKLMVALQFTFEGAPCVYYGDEIGMEGAKDPECRRCYPWHKPELQNCELFAYYKKLIAIRKTNPALRVGTFRPFAVDNERELYAFERRTGGNHCIVVLNRSEDGHELKLDARIKGKELLSGRELNSDRVTAPARQAIILAVD